MNTVRHKDEPLIVQMKMVSGEIVLAEPVNMDDKESMRFRGCLEMIPMIEDYEEIIKSGPGPEYYILKPWVTYTDDVMETVSVNPLAIVYNAMPSEQLLNQYHRSVEEIIEQLEADRETGSHPKQSPKLKGEVVSFRPKIVPPTILTED